MAISENIDEWEKRCREGNDYCRENGHEFASYDGWCPRDGVVENGFVLRLELGQRVRVSTNLTAVSRGDAIFVSQAGPLLVQWLHDKEPHPVTIQDNPLI